MHIKCGKLWNFLLFKEKHAHGIYANLINSYWLADGRLIIFTEFLARDAMSYWWRNRVRARASQRYWSISVISLRWNITFVVITVAEKIPGERKALLSCNIVHILDFLEPPRSFIAEQTKTLHYYTDKFHNIGYLSYTLREHSYIYIYIYPMDNTSPRCLSDVRTDLKRSRR